MKIKPFEDKVLLKPIVEKETITASGFILQSNKEDKPSEAIVEAVGPGIVFPNGAKLEIDLKPGDKVSYSKFAGVEYEEYILIPYKDILVVLGE
jgi:chaperonin GroES